MTAEVGILNQNGVALAADSAVTITTDKDVKVFNSVNKLFRLSRKHPVGIMIYGSASILGVPWEVIIKLYRSQLDDKKFEDLYMYGQNFLDYLVENQFNFFPVENQRQYIYQTSLGICNDIVQQSNSKIEKILREDKITENKIKKIVAEKIDKAYEYINKIDNISSGLTVKYIRNNFLRTIKKGVGDGLQKMPIFKKDLNRIVNLICLYFTKDLFSPAHSGVIFAGYGENDFYPKLISYKVEAVIKDRTRYSNDRKTEITFQKRSEIHSFAQGEMVHTFIEGIDPEQFHTILIYLQNIFSRFPELVIKILENDLKIPKDNRKNIIELMKKGMDMLNEEFVKQFHEYRHKKHVAPILSMVAMLPKDELSTMAETLVNLTSFKRRVSMDTETVGGPIDVAIITKGDGFIWVKRKPKFDLKLNSHLIGESI